MTFPLVISSNGKAEKRRSVNFLVDAKIVGVIYVPCIPLRITKNIFNP